MLQALDALKEDAYGTNIEGEWDEVFAVVKKCHERIHEMVRERYAGAALEVLEEALRAAGFEAKAHYDAHYDVILPPLAVRAGLGELGLDAGDFVTRDAVVDLLLEHPELVRFAADHEDDATVVSLAFEDEHRNVLALVERASPTGGLLEAMRVVHLLARVPRGTALRVRDIVDQLGDDARSHGGPAARVRRRVLRKRHRLRPRLHRRDPDVPGRRPELHR